MPQTRSQSLQAAANSITLNWLLFDQSYELEGFPISVPRDLFVNAVHGCREVFAEQLWKELKFAAEINSIRFWKPRRTISASDLNKPGWREKFQTVEATAERLQPFETLSDRLGQSLNQHYVHLIITAQKAPERSRGSTAKASDKRSGLPENLHYMDVVAHNGVAPYQAAKSAELIKIQCSPTHLQTIYDGRYAMSGPSTLAPPIHIFHPIFGSFARRLAEDTAPLECELLSLTQRFMAEALMIHTQESERVADFKLTLKKILERSVRQEANTNNRMADGVCSIEINHISVPILTIELKRELGEGSCDPSTQVGFSARQSWIEKHFSHVRDQCCCPMLMIAGGGPWMAILGGVFLDRPIVQRLTDMLWIGHGSTHSQIGIEYLARVLRALKQTLDELSKYYKDLDVPEAFDSNNLNVSYPRFYPHITSFPEKGDRVVKFKYIKRLQDDIACVAFLASTEDGRPIVVKFVTTYSDDVHRLLATQGLAPNILYCDPIPDASTPSSAIYTQGPRLLFKMRMVVMDHIEDCGPPSDLNVIRQQLKAALGLLHENGYVLGDLRKPNVLFDSTGQLKLIDFDWAGRSKPERDGKFFDPNYAHYPPGLSQNIIWAKGANDYGLILPEHDLEMMENLLDDYRNHI
ncbi:hypothetical protein AMATHDRAFT_5521 [Amanita thiersii Skay4041]|uniref:Protein kinase domain-containing protein n=1 Tax=Amanita thiersii Skay4041 TaxID=703135 RepID=A0A2A9NKD3_9AGAR|nr:hypothetical protein AMATHDRAFT_5521 [Amanita thiersii Skay4041]